MKRMRLAIVGALVLITFVFVYSQTSRRTTQTPQSRLTTEPITIEAVVTTQQRINHYFHNDVISKLPKCWSTVRGKGTIAFEYTYTKANGRWLFNRLQLGDSTLPKGQDSLAQKCMLIAVGGTSFAIEESENSEDTYVLNWKWPVPFPTNATQLTSTMFAARLSNGAGETDDCDGSGTRPKCYTCTLSFSCKKVCVGGKTCTLDSDDPKSPCRAQGYCASGGPFGIMATTRAIPTLRESP